VDVKTLLLLGIGMLVLLLVGLWAARSSSAELILGRVQPHQRTFAQPDMSNARLPGHRRSPTPAIAGMRVARY
jgi:hypothetical protein